MALNMNIKTKINMDQYIKGSIWHQYALSSIDPPIQAQFIWMHIDAVTIDQYTLMHIDATEMHEYILSCIGFVLMLNILMHQYVLMHQYTLMAMISSMDKYQVCRIGTYPFGFQITHE